MKSLNNKILLCIWAPVFVLSTALVLQASKFGLWREFVVSEFQLIITGACLSYFFRNGEKQ